MRYFLLVDLVAMFAEFVWSGFYTDGEKNIVGPTGSTFRVVSGPRLNCISDLVRRIFGVAFGRGGRQTAGTIVSSPLPPSPKRNSEKLSDQVRNTVLVNLTIIFSRREPSL